jgi:hypothetical protein
MCANGKHHLWWRLLALLRGALGESGSDFGVGVVDLGLTLDLRASRLLRSRVRSTRAES